MSLASNFVRTQWRAFNSIHPLVKGSITYAILWPTGSVIHQTLDGKNLKTYDYMKLLRYGIFGSLYVAPTLYCWVKLTSAMWPQMSLRIGLTKAAIEQISYGPFACASFFFGMSLLENKTVDEAVQEVKDKFLPTFKTGMCIWPILQTINFSMIPERQRVVYVAICSLLWTSFLAYMKSTDIQNQQLSDKIQEETSIPLQQNSKIFV